MARLAANHDMTIVHGPTPPGANPVEFSLDPYAGLHYGTKIILPLTSETGDSVLDHLDSGESIDPGRDGVITYAFYNAQHSDGWLAAGHYPGYIRDDDGDLVSIRGGAQMTPFSAEQEAAARAAIELWDDLVAVEFREVSGQGSGTADIVLANSADPAQAFAYYGGSFRGGWDGYLGDVFIADPALNPSNSLFHYGQYGNTTLIHELGHSIGLSHPGAYNYDPNVTQDFAGLAEYAQDTYQYSIMSYWNGTNSGQLAINWDMGGVAAIGGYNSTTGTYAFSFRPNYPEAPQLHDIFAIQEKYGADLTTRADATTYGFNSNAGNGLYDFNANPNPMYSIYDAGGNDTIDASGFDVGQFIDLHPGSFSSIGGGAPSAEHVNAYWTEYYAAYGLEFPAGYFTEAFLASAEYVVQLATEYRIERDTGVGGVYATQYDNVSIAYGTTIENAIGGSARDLIRGNEVANVLKGMGGGDVLQGFGGDDTLIGGTGNDALTGGAGSDLFVFANDGSIDTMTDFATGVDKVDLRQVAGATAGYVSYDATSHQVQIDTDHNGVADMFINSAKNTVGSGDYLLFA